MTNPYYNHSSLDDILTNLEISEPVLEAAIKLLNTVCTQQEFLLKVTELVSSFRDVYEQPSDVTPSIAASNPLTSTRQSQNTSESLQTSKHLTLSNIPCASLILDCNQRW